MTAREGLTLSKSMHEVLDRHLKGNNVDLSLSDLRSDCRTLNSIINKMAREAEFNNARAIAEKDALRAELHCEQVDREANAARISERQRFLFERSAAQPGQASAAERAAASAAFVEAALVSLCPHSTPRSPGCDQLAAMD